ncbi:adenylate/guanylate cyclase domain-containing protein [Acrocarpospora sp. B8E8]|uniref:adenylate/guanylate cyclase domain-containing protein n=1 Tax=Acrocarpospora sp. B8E8 TaxID=3153572 RepID=UPI00325DD08A
MALGHFNDSFGALMSGRTLRHSVSQFLAAFPQPVRPDPIPTASAYIDLRQSTDLTSMLGVQVMRDLLQIIFSPVALLAEAEGGKIYDMHGDGALVAFRGDNRVDRAFATAMMVQRSIVTEFQPGLASATCGQIKLRFRIGIDDGPMCSGIVTDLSGPARTFWVGGNIGNKISQAMEPSMGIAVSQRAFDLLSPEIREKNIWSDPVEILIGGESLLIRTCPQP